MSLKDVKQLLNDVSLKLLNYEDGDVYLLSDVIDKIKKVKNLLNNPKEINHIFIIIENSLNILLRGNKINNFDNIFSIGIDLINRYLNETTKATKKNKKTDELLLNDIEKFENENYIYLDQTAETKRNYRKSNKKEFDNKKENAKEKNKKGNAGKIFNISLNSESLKIFIVEAEDRLTQAQDIILKLEKDFQNKELLNNLFRIFHTIKGECGFLRLASLGELAHNLENLMDLLRNNEIKSDPEIIDILFMGIDYFYQMLIALKEGNITVFNEINVDSFIDSINTHINEVKTSVGTILQNEGKLTDLEIQKILQKQKESAFTKKFGEIAVEGNLISEDEFKETLVKQKIQEETKTFISEKLDPFIKVKSSQVNYLVDMVGELLIAENQLEDKNINQLKKITREIQSAAMQLRTVKVKNLFINMKRIVRDLSKKLNKEIICEIQGDELEIDRNIVETLEEPLMHIIRNSISHGIEDIEERKKKGKNDAGMIKISAERRGNNIVISVSDDGRGLDKEKILEKAISKKIIDKDKAKSLSLNEIYNFIFIPGFSTAQNVDTVSGRGVGMDIVKKTVTNLRGNVEVVSEKDKYTSINLVFPLSMAIIDGLIVNNNGIQFIIPILNVIESLKIDENIIHSVKHKAKVINLREEIIPVVELNEYFCIKEVKNRNKLIAVIVESNKRKYALIIDEIIAKKEVVIKSLGNKFNKLNGISSGTILSNGKVGFVLNVEQIVGTHY